ncbi:Thioredoxin [Zhouia amylolytica]|uniref:Thioredoxin n=1 Tax=Zhouia amylolytica TaxID=376730 RepID=A0A1I6VG21_9FLAO|nr:thioredoxin domain-containing protein [Zhouia amylolytica]SFT12683.1 Thioredoxin [Zhouia amylolytica]
MKRNVLMIIALVSFAVFSSAAQGIEFQHISLKEALKKANSENKLVFIDFYTTWCAPCKAMAKNVFTLPEVGKVYNKEYINIKLDAEKEGLEAAKKYKVNSYPTYIYLNPNGNLVYKESGARMADDFIKIGREAVASANSQYSLEKLQTDFPDKQDDADFLKIYFTKLLEYGQNPSEGIDAWLRVQNEIEEDDVDMMEFLLKYRKYILAGSKGEDIINENFEEYMDIATRKEEGDLERFQVQIVQNTKDFAYESRSPELWLTFMKSFNKLPENYKKRGNLLEYKMVYYAMLKDENAYKDVVEVYVDSLMADKSIVEIKALDEKIYEKRAKPLEGNKAPEAIRMLEAYKNGVKGASIAKEIHQKGRAYLDYINTKREYKTLEKWIGYGYELGSSKYLIDDLKSKMYYKRGKTKKAIEFKEMALESWPENDKKLSAKKYELEQMKKGELL